MRRLERLGYMGLGAVILGVGMIIGQWLAPPIEAQSNGVFNTITCRRIEVVDALGKLKCLILDDTHGGRVVVYGGLLPFGAKRGASMGIDARGGRFDVYNNQEKTRAVMVWKRRGIHLG